MAQAQYWIEITNDYLGKYRRVTGRSRREVELKASEQLQRWSEQELRAREREAVADLKQRALDATEVAARLIASHRAILQATLAVDDRLNWSSMRDRRTFDAPKPTLASARVKVGVPEEKPFAERFSKSRKERRLRAEEQATVAHDASVRAWEDRKAQYEERQARTNGELDAFRSSYEAGEVEAVERYVSLVLGASIYPEGFDLSHDIAYSSEDRTLVVEMALPGPDDLPSVVEYRYVASRREIDEKLMKDRDRISLYDDAIVQTALRTVHEILEGDYRRHCGVVVLNGVVDAVDASTGKEFRACIVSLQAEREAFERLDLERVEPRACFRALKGLSGASFASLQPVQPIRTFDKDDPRFIEADGVLDGLEADQNLMTMAWQDFEVLIRDVFDKVFATRGADVRVTRTSRDQGVDAVVFDPDPLLGGKLVIQAKRYRNTVPVAAVRELYGTMLNEGAGKGILVTTSHFGASAQEFVKDKPITLVDGPHLLHLLQNQGHHIRIDLNEGVTDESLIGPM